MKLFNSEMVRKALCALLQMKSLFMFSFLIQFLMFWFKNDIKAVYNYNHLGTKKQTKKTHFHLKN